MLTKTRSGKSASFEMITKRRSLFTAKPTRRTRSGAGGEVHLLHRVFEVAITFAAELAMLADLARAHGRVGGVGRFFETLYLSQKDGIQSH